MRAERNPNANCWQKPADYKDLGWQLWSGNSAEIKACRDLKHQLREFDNSLYKFRCTDVVHICDTCKHVWHIDSSD